MDFYGQRKGHEIILDLPSGVVHTSKEVFVLFMPLNSH